MNERHLIDDFGFDPLTATGLAALLDRASRRPSVIPKEERERRIAELPDLSGTMRIEGLDLTAQDQEFHSHVYGLGLDDETTDALILAYARAVHRKNTNMALAAE